jgi:hypothetical protein
MPDSREDNEDEMDITSNFSEGSDIVEVGKSEKALSIGNWAQVARVPKMSYTGVRYRVVKVSKKLCLGSLVYTVPTFDIQEENSSILCFGLSVATDISHFVGRYAAVQFSTIDAGQGTTHSLFWVPTCDFLISSDRREEAKRAKECCSDKSVFA